MMNNIWESSSDQFNCSLCGADEPFYMPLRRTDIVGMRVQVPYSYLVKNSGSMPIGANVALSIVDEIGTTTYCDLSTANNGRFLLGFVNDTTNKKAQYQIWTPIPLKDENTIYYSQYYFTASSGQLVEITSGFNFDGVRFIYGVDPLPENVLELKPGVLVVSLYPNPFFGNFPSNVLTVNNVVVAFTLLYGTRTACDHELYNCFRFKLVVTFTNSGETLTLYTKPYRIERCDTSVRVKCVYPLNTYDMNDYNHTASWNISVINPNNLINRIPADVETESSKITKSYNQKCYNYRSETQRMYRIKSDPVPDWFAFEVENVLAGQSMTIDNVGYDVEGTEAFKNIDLNNSTFQNLDLLLSQCKTEKVFVC